MAEENAARLAMLIDADNAEASLIAEMIAETSKYGIVTIRRIYGDWTTSNMNSWKPVLNEHAIQPCTASTLAFSVDGRLLPNTATEAPNTARIRTHSSIEPS